VSILVTVYLQVGDFNWRVMNDPTLSMEETAVSRFKAGADINAAFPGMMDGRSGKQSAVA